MNLRAKFLRVGPGGADGKPTIEVELVTGETLSIPLDRAHGRAVAGRLIECVDGRISARSCARQTLEIELVVGDDIGHAQTEPPPARSA